MTDEVSSKHCFASHGLEVVDRTDAVSSKHCFEVVDEADVVLREARDTDAFEEIFEEYKLLIK
ncbi:chlorohydrolase [Streptococcus pneumoniae]|nr:chlorohydrolase [Streptococcus pneumoniae]